MNCLDSSVVIDVLNDASEISDRLNQHEEPFYAPTIVLAEVLEGLIASGRSDTDAERQLSWLAPLEFTPETALEAAHIRNELRQAGDLIPVADMFIAGVVRAESGTLLTQDEHFEAVPDLNVVVF